MGTKGQIRFHLTQKLLVLVRAARTDSRDETIEAKRWRGREAQVGTEDASRLIERSRSMLEPPAAAG